MSIIRLSVIPLAFALAVAAPSAQAPSASGLDIRNVIRNADGTTMTINGVNFGDDPHAVLDGFVLVVNSATDTMIEAVIPATVLATPGTYRLTVARTNPEGRPQTGRPQFDEFEITFAIGPSAQVCDPGQAVVGFDSAGGILCEPFGEPPPLRCEDSCFFEVVP